MIGLFFDEVEIGREIVTGSYAFTRENVLEFAKLYDPQAFHLDDAAAMEGPFGKLAASGWHTAAAWMKCYVAVNDAARAEKVAAGNILPELGPSPGFRNLRWLRPVFPGDTVTYRAVITGKRELASLPKWGMLDMLNDGHNQDGELVYSFEGKVLVQRR